MHFPERNTVWSIGSGYGGNALLGKKCLALRLASWLARKEGWLAEHMLILGLQDPQGKMHYIAGAFPSACGKTNLAMLVPPKALPGWKATTVGDDIAWLRPGSDGRLWAVNPESGFFGVVPGTSRKTNPTAFDMIQRNTIFTNVALRPDGTPWWEGHDDPPPAEALDWQGRPWTPASTEKAAHPNSRFTTPATQCASLSPEFENPNGVPIDAMIFGARRQRRIPLVYEGRNWQHGTFLGATLSSETTAAATGKVGVLRRDPMAMWPFCGYNMGDYFQHWLDVGAKLAKPPKIFRVNWFRTGEAGRFLWPGFGDNLRVLKWILDRCEGKGKAVETVIGAVPTPDGIDRTGLNLSDADMAELLKVDPAEWVEAIAGQEELMQMFGDRMPRELCAEHEDLAGRINAAITPHDLFGRDSGGSWRLRLLPIGSIASLHSVLQFHDQDWRTPSLWRRADLEHDRPGVHVVPVAREIRGADDQVIRPLAVPVEAVIEQHLGSRHLESGRVQVGRPVVLDGDPWCRAACSPSTSRSPARACPTASAGPASGRFRRPALASAGSHDRGPAAGPPAAPAAGTARGRGRPPARRPM